MPTLKMKGDTRIMKVYKISNFSIINLRSFGSAPDSEIITSGGIRSYKGQEPRIKFLELFDKKMVCLEIGVKKGSHACQMYNVLNPSELHLVDIVDKREKNPELKNLTSRDNVNFLVEDSKKCHSLFPNEFFDFIYIDGNHKYEEVLSDLENWVPKVKNGGWITGHDFKFASHDSEYNKRGFNYCEDGLILPSNQSGGVAPAVASYLHKNNIRNLTLYWEGDILKKERKGVSRKKKSGFEFCVHKIFD